MNRLTRIEAALWLGLLAALLVPLLMPQAPAWLFAIPEGWLIDIRTSLNHGMDGTVAALGAYFQAASGWLDVVLSGVRWVLNAAPWPLTILLAALVAHAASGWRLAAFTALAMLYMAVVGYWEESMNSLSLVLLSVPLAVGIGFALGVWAYASRTANAVIQPLLDLLQTIPTFAYLLPILLLFGFGPVVGLIASILYAFPPMVRNTVVGLRGVDPEIIEAGQMSGASTSQLFWRVRVPAAERPLLLGLNQTTMAALSMVIIASLIGGTADIGWEVLSKLRKAQFGESLLAGIVIALIAMILDRVTSGFARRDASEAGAGSPGRRRLMIALFGAAVLIPLAMAVPAIKQYPRALEIYPAQFLNDAVDYIVINYQPAINAIKTFAFFYAMLPLKTGFDGTVSPWSWGFALTDLHRWGYAVAVGVSMLVAWGSGRQRLAIAIGFCGILLWFGLGDLPWLPLILLAVLLSWSVSGPALAVGTALGLGFIALAGVWPQAMLSVYLCALATVIAFGVGAALGIWAAHNDGVSGFLRPINDTLQTMPLFVLLIPFVMIFKIGEFTALLAIIAYAIVPAIRYTESGIRGVPADAVEAAEQMGCSFWQMLWRVKLPLAAPVMLLGLNQTVMYAIAMLVIAALVGTNGLGQQVYIGLGDGDFGVSMIAGLGMAFIAMIADRLLQSMAKAKRARAA